MCESIEEFGEQVASAKLAAIVDELRARVAELEAVREGMRNAVAVALDDHLADPNLRARIRVAIAAELLVTAAAHEERPDTSAGGG